MMPSSFSEADASDVFFAARAVVRFVGSVVASIAAANIPVSSFLMVRCFIVLPFFCVYIITSISYIRKKCSDFKGRLRVKFHGNEMETDDRERAKRFLSIPGSSRFRKIKIVLENGFVYDKMYRTLGELFFI